MPSRQRRTLNRELSHEKKKLIERVRSGKGEKIKTHARDMVILLLWSGLR